MSTERQAVEAWANYCTRFGHNPYALLGSCYPGLEQHRMTTVLANLVVAEIERARLIYTTGLKKRK